MRRLKAMLRLVRNAPMTLADQLEGYETRIQGHVVYAKALENELLARNARALSRSIVLAL